MKRPDISTWLLALLSALVILLTLLATRRYGFVWETTILGADTFVAVTQALGTLPALLGFNVPTVEMIRASGMEKTYGMQARSDTIAQHPDLIEEWAKIGLGGVLIGFETPCPERLKKLNKSNSLRNNDETIRICQANGVDVWGAFIVNPDFDADDFQRLLDYVDDHDIKLRQFTVLTPLPGTPLFEQGPRGWSRGTTASSIVCTRCCPHGCLGKNSISVSPTCTASRT
jgi:hypothetical protein